MDNSSPSPTGPILTPTNWTNLHSHQLDQSSLSPTGPIFTLTNWTTPHSNQLDHSSPSPMVASPKGRQRFSTAWTSFARSVRAAGDERDLPIPTHILKLTRSHSPIHSLLVRRSLRNDSVPLERSCFREDELAAKRE